MFQKERRYSKKVTVVPIRSAFQRNYRVGSQQRPHTPLQSSESVFSTLKAKSNKQGCVVHFLDPDFQEGADTLPRLALTHIALKPNKLEKRSSCFPSCMMHSLHQTTGQKTRKRKKNRPCSDQARKKKNASAGLCGFFLIFTKHQEI